MKLIVDTDAQTIETTSGTETQRHALFSESGFDLISDLWLQVGWAQRYSYSFTWLGRPIIQMPEDILRIQEVVYRLQPDVIIETGIARGGSLILYASLLQLLGKGKVVGVDIDIRAPNRQAIEAHPLASRITMIEGSSTDPAIADQVRQHLGPADKVLVILDSNHTREHVLNELRLYAPLVSVGSYAVAADGVMQLLTDVPGGQAAWEWDNPALAARDFVGEREDFVLEEPEFVFNHSDLNRRVTYWPGAYIKRVQ